jgi:transcriptional regulator with XRE-family HTH domain
MNNSESFAGWLNKELDRRGWSRSEAARRGEISPSMFDKVIGGFANPGPDFLIGVARAFGLTRREVFQRAGMIEPDPPTDTPTIREMNEAFAYLTSEEQRNWLRMLENYVADRRGVYRADIADVALRPGATSDSA